MPFDALTLAAVRQEIQEKLVGGRVQNVIMPGPLALSLEIYRAGTGRAHLLMSAHPQHARVHLTPTAPSRDPEQHPPLLLLLRKYVRGGTIIDVSQPRFERVLTLSIAKRLPPDKHQEYHFEGDFRHTEDRRPSDRPRTTGVNEGSPCPWASACRRNPLSSFLLLTIRNRKMTKKTRHFRVRTTELIVEIMGRVSNIVMVEEDGTVMDSIKRIPSSINRYRVTLPHHPYVLPPPQEKRDPTHTTINAYRSKSLGQPKATQSARLEGPGWRLSRPLVPRWPTRSSSRLGRRESPRSRSGLTACCAAPVCLKKPRPC